MTEIVVKTENGFLVFEAEDNFVETMKDSIKSLGSIDNGSFTLESDDIEKVYVALDEVIDGDK